MRLQSSLLALLLFPCELAAGKAGFSVLGADPGAWPQILSSIGLLSSAEAGVFVARFGTAVDPHLRQLVEDGAYLILEGKSPMAESYGFGIGPETRSVTSMTDVHQPALPLVLREPLVLGESRVAPNATIFTKERWTGMPVVAGLKQGKGAVLWVAADPGAEGYERFPYVLNALTDLGFQPPFRTNRLWAFFDYSYRSRVDVDYFAVKWRKAGIGALHVAAWHFYEADPQRDAYLKHLIEACHREGITVYAWLELPHVSEKFWGDHPEWREKTAVLQDAALDWRKLMNLADRDCFRAVSAGVSELIGRFDWDGVNLAELYFESLEGAANPARFTPMNSTVRRDFLNLHGFDPVELWTTRKDAASLRLFLDYRAGIVQQMQGDWLVEIEKCRKTQPDLDIVLTHVDDRIDRGMTDAIGADSSRVLPLLDTHNFTFLVEDPATVWNLGPKRYPSIAKRYPGTSKLAVDINIVERYQDVYPTKQQTGSELYQLIHYATNSFPRVALYFESSIFDPDLRLLPTAGVGVLKYEAEHGDLLVDSPLGFVLNWPGAMSLDGKLWLASNGTQAMIPKGRHTVQRGVENTGALLLDFNGDLEAVEQVAGGLEIHYSSDSRALARLNCDVSNITIDGIHVGLRQSGSTILLPSGKRHVVALCK